jgi:hypothetical protein
MLLYLKTIANTLVEKDKHIMKKRKKKHILLIIVGIIVVLIIISNISDSIKKRNAQKVTYAWPTSGIATLLPEPDTQYGKIKSDSVSSFSIELYSVSSSDFDDYVSQCKNSGFTVDYNGSDAHYYADDESGNSLSIIYQSDDKEMDVSISAAPEEIEETEEIENDINDNLDVYSDSEADESVEEATDDDTEEAPLAGETDEKTDEATVETAQEIADDTSDSQTDSIQFREWVDSYEEFMNQYVEFMKTYDGSNTAALAEYMQLLNQYAEFADDTANLNEKDYSAADWAYYTAAQMRVLDKLSTVQ